MGSVFRSTVILDTVRHFAAVVSAADNTDVENTAGPRYCDRRAEVS